jgi:enterochelin esterase-like enzyme
VDLTSEFFLVVLVLATVAAVAGAVVFWPRLAAPSPTVIAGRLGVLLGVNVLVLATVGAVANDTFGFFADWTDLAGAFQSTPGYNASSHGGPAAAAAQAPVAGPRLTGPSGRALPPLPRGASSGRQLMFTVTGAASHLRGEVLVELPAGYTRPAQAKRIYPVIETFHGYPGTPQQWLDSMALGQVIDSEVTARRLSPTLIVAPQLEIPPGRDAECVDGGHGLPAVETWLTTDVPNWVARTFRVRLDRASWATAGLSAGGWCAAMAALLHPARYGAAVIFGGYFTPRFSATYVPFAANSPQERRYDLATLVKKSPPPLAMWVETSHSDRTSYRSTARFLAGVRPPLSVHLVEFAHAGHSILLWAGLVPDAVRWLETIPGFRPSPSALHAALPAD